MLSESIRCSPPQRETWRKVSAAAAGHPLGLVMNSLTFQNYIILSLIYYLLWLFNQFLKSVSLCLYVHLGKKKTDKEGRPKGNKEVYKLGEALLTHESHINKIEWWCLWDITQKSLLESGIAEDQQRDEKYIPQKSVLVTWHESQEYFYFTKKCPDPSWRGGSRAGKLPWACMNNQLWLLFSHDTEIYQKIGVLAKLFCLIWFLFPNNANK